MIEEKWGNFFKPEVKSSGRKLVAQDKVSISSFTDTSIQAFVRVSPPVKVALVAEEVTSTEFSASCSCPAAKKSRLCKHIWATMISADLKNSDFFEGKNEVNLLENNPSDLEVERISVQDTARQKANDYRKDQYQKQKARLKDQKLERKGRSNAASLHSYSTEVEASLAYFTLNGFPMPSGPSEDVISEAKRKLSRIFHPDKGGTHEETVELNRHCEVLMNFLG